MSDRITTQNDRDIEKLQLDIVDLKKQLYKLNDLYEFIMWGEPFEKENRKPSLLERIHKLERQNNE